MSFLKSGALALGLAATLASAQDNKLTQCPATNVCYSLSIPPSTASSGSGDIYMQISAPTSYSWVALGQGDDMTGSNMFIMYTSGNGKNVTVSPRRATRYVMPNAVTDVQMTVVQGSGVSDGQMVANIKCSNCNSWNGGSMNFQSGPSQWIYAYKSGAAINSDDAGATIAKHDENGNIQWDVTKARATASGNPFIAADGSTSATNSSSTNGANGDGSSSSSSGDGGKYDTYITAHGSLATIAFVAVFPLGALLVRFGNFKGTVWAHAAVQALAYTLFIAGAGIGIWVATNLSLLGSYHAIIGMILLGLIFFMPALGLIHHISYQKTQSRGVFSYLHILIGRAGIILGIINGGFGLQLAGAGRAEYIAYGVCAGVVGVVYIAAFVFGEIRRSKLRRSASPSLSMTELKRRSA